MFRYAPAFTPDDRHHRAAGQLHSRRDFEPAREPHRAVFASGVRYDAPSTTGAPHGDNRFTRPVKGKSPGDYRQIGEEFNPQLDEFLRRCEFLPLQPRPLQHFPQATPIADSCCARPATRPRRPMFSTSADLNAEPTTPIGIVTYSRLLKPGETWTLDFKMPRHSQRRSVRHLRHRRRELRRREGAGDRLLE